MITFQRTDVYAGVYRHAAGKDHVLDNEVPTAAVACREGSGCRRIARRRLRLVRGRSASACFVLNPDGREIWRVDVKASAPPDAGS